MFVASPKAQSSCWVASTCPNDAKLKIRLLVVSEGGFPEWALSLSGNGAIFSILNNFSNKAIMRIILVQKSFV